jgi:hypothetical protein
MQETNQAQPMKRGYQRGRLKVVSGVCDLLLAVELNRPFNRPTGRNTQIANFLWHTAMRHQCEHDDWVAERKTQTF